MSAEQDPSDLPPPTPEQIAQIEAAIARGDLVLPPEVTAAHRMQRRITGARAKAGETITEVDARAAEHREAGKADVADALLAGRAYLLAKDVQFLHGVILSSAEHLAQMTRVFEAAVRVTERPDSDNLAALAATVRDARRWAEERATMAGPGAKA